MKQFQIDIQRVLTDRDYLETVTNMNIITVEHIRWQPGQFHNLNTQAHDDVTACIMLQDRQIGHYVEFNKQPVTNWQAGQGYVWENTISVNAVTAGFGSWYVLLIKGSYKK